MKYLFTLFFFLNIATIGYNQSGTLDKTFGDSGVAIDKQANGSCHNLILQKDGKIVSIGTDYSSYGNSLLVRYNTDGAPDLSFGDSGKVISEFSPRGSSGDYGVLQADGKIIVAGNIGGDLAVVKYNPDGKLDSAFGTNGLVIESFGAIQKTSGVVLQSDGKIVVFGATYTTSEDRIPTNLYIVRYNSNGSLDQSFGNKGIHQEFDLDPIDVAGVALQEDGKIVIGGSYAVSKSLAFFVKRYTKDGFPDTGFGTQGEAQYSFSEPTDYTSNTSIALQQDGRIVCGGSSSAMGSYIYNATVVRFNTDGSTDKSFGNNGIVVTPLDAKTGLAINDIAIEANGKIIAGARAYDGFFFQFSNFASIQYTSNGTVDSSYGTNGIEITTLDGKVIPTSLALQQDGKLILGGNLYTPSAAPYNFITLVRYNGDNTKQPLAIRIKRWLQHHGISWQLTQNSNVRYYTIQRSNDGIVYKEIAKLPNSSSNYEDATAITGNSYYRLAAIAKDGSRTYSNTVLIDESSQVKIFPNPVHNTLQLQGLSADSKTNISITDFNGSVRTTATTGGGSYSVNTANLTPGNYLLKLQHNGTVTTQAFVKE